MCKPNQAKALHQTKIRTYLKKNENMWKQNAIRPEIVATSADYLSFLGFQFYRAWCYTTIISSETPGWHTPFPKLLTSGRTLVTSDFCYLLCSLLQSWREAGGAEKSCCLTEATSLLKENLHVLVLCNILLYSWFHRHCKYSFFFFQSA